MNDGGVEVGVSWALWSVIWKTSVDFILWWE